MELEDALGQIEKLENEVEQVRNTSYMNSQPDFGDEDLDQIQGRYVVQPFGKKDSSTKPPIMNKPRDASPMPSLALFHGEGIQHSKIAKDKSASLLVPSKSLANARQK